MHVVKSPYVKMLSWILLRGCTVSISISTEDIDMCSTALIRNVKDRPIMPAVAFK